jgi:hypothetical protein
MAARKARQAHARGEIKMRGETIKIKRRDER